VANGNCLAGEGPQASACSRTRAQRERHTLILESPPLMTAIVTPAYPAVNGTFTRHNSRCRVGCSLRGPVQALRRPAHPREPVSGHAGPLVSGGRDAGPATSHERTTTTTTTAALLTF
jgi:hypothetical protein